MSYQRPPTASRPPTSGVPRGMRPPSRTRNGTEISTPGKISVVNRPLTKQGLPSAHTQSGGRQVADKSYFIGVLRKKINETKEEIERLESETEQRKRGQSIQVNLEQQVSSLRAEISESEAILADYNVLSDRISNGTSIDDMISCFESLEKSNNQLEDEVNSLFREKRNIESIVTDQEKQVQALVKGQGSPELQSMAKEIESLENQLKEFQNQNSDLQGKSREELLQLVKEATKKIGDVNQQIQDEQKSLGYIQNQIKSIEEREGDLQTEHGRQYIKLLQREKDMNTFIQNYPQNLENIQQNLKATQKHVFEVLSETSNELESVNNLPSIDNFKQMQNDLAYKERLIQDTQTTTIALQQEVERRKRELDDLKNVDQRIEQEIQQLKVKMKEMEEEMPNFEDVDSVREEGEIRKKMKTNERDRLKNELHNLRKATNALATQYNEAKAKLRNNEVNSKLHLLEKEIRARAQDNNQTLESIEENRRRTNYAIVKRASMNIVDEINGLL
ncbi:intraflagellar transport protein [Histomonas meleagridis]|uniref:intraflagellar transport protein 74-like isoform X1 n=1 Tax=Histomonas meleagridis TaxID=135588 RepID=UPI003559FD9D|nr:intraflagellar transport protein [Histomonas meleagridis]KAH0797632.1 intraflagellar transport protein 74-like isoform X1 [Histomonas meleagridis]